MRNTCRVLLLLLTLALGLSLCACGGGETGGTGEAPPAQNVGNAQSQEKEQTAPDDGETSKGAEEIAREVFEADPYYQEHELELGAYSIIKRQTNLEDKNDLVWLSLEASNDKCRTTTEYELEYVLYNEGWLLENWADTTRDVKPLVDAETWGVDLVACLQLASDRRSFPAGHFYDPAEDVYDHTADLENGRDTYSFTYTIPYKYLVEQLDVTLTMYFDPVMCEWNAANSNVVIKSREEDWESLAGQYGHNTISLADDMLTINGTYHHPLEPFTIEKLNELALSELYHERAKLYYQGYKLVYVYQYGGEPIDFTGIRYFVGYGNSAYMIGPDCVYYYEAVNGYTNEGAHRIEVPIKKLDQVEQS